MALQPRQLLVYQAPTGTVPFNVWLNKLKDHQAIAAIDVRLGRLTLGLFGDCKSVGDGVHELRVHLGPGYQIYYGLEGESVIVLLFGGDKASQAQDIVKAKRYLQDYRSEAHA